MKKGLPISPDDIIESEVARIPGFVFDAFNELISKDYNFKYKTATVLQKDVVRIIKRLNNGNCDSKWLDIEKIYGEKGWHVKYDNPGYCDNNSYEPYFLFTKK